MRQMTIYVTDDGKRFDTAEAALEHEAIEREAARILGAMPTKFELGYGKYLQHPPGTYNAVREARREFLRWLVRNPPRHKSMDHTGLREAVEAFDDPESEGDVSGYWLSRRIFHESTPWPSANSIFYRYECFAEDDREYQQVYLKNHPEEAEEVLIPGYPPESPAPPPDDRIGLLLED